MIKLMRLGIVGFMQRETHALDRKLIILTAASGIANAMNLAVINAAVDALPNVGQIALSCALGYRDLRFGGDWRVGLPHLVAWLDDFAARVPAYAATQATE